MNINAFAGIRRDVSRNNIFAVKNSDSVRSIDVCEKMGFSKPSVSRAVGLLKQGGYLYTDKNGYLFLTDEGKKVAHKTYERHVVLSQFFESIGVSAETATNDACKIEHVISDETFNAVKSCSVTNNRCLKITDKSDKAKKSSCRFFIKQLKA